FVSSMLITILVMIKPTAPLTQFAPFRLIPGWKYASRSGSYHVGQGCRLTSIAKTGILGLVWLGFLSFGEADNRGLQTALGTGLSDE
ncbi:hypothetical protein, partial [Gemmatimonas sp.]|uniref:hypothetical protein n=1 Tax=Gemmatimonas sp. TaxID=1962908 RepID=UPI0035670103